MAAKTDERLERLRRAMHPPSVYGPAPNEHTISREDLRWLIHEYCTLQTRCAKLVQLLDVNEKETTT